MLAVVPNNPLGNPKIADKSQEGVELRLRIRKTLTQAVDLQHLAYDVAMLLKEANVSKEEAEAKRAHAQAVASIIKAWDISADRVRIVRGKGLPSNVAVKPVKKSKTKMPTFSETKPD